MDMALHVPPAQEKKRVKVYELRENDWHDKGTGFCTAQMIDVSLELNYTGHSVVMAYQC